jgi:hypothetical protein
LVALARQVAQHALGVGPFGHAFDDRRLHAGAERLLHRAPAEVVLVAPAGLADRAHVDEADLERIGGGAGAQRGAAQERGQQPAGEVF